MRSLRRAVRLPLLIVHVALGCLVISLSVLIDRLLRKPLHHGLARRMQALWCRSICRLMGVRIQLTGQAMAAPPVLLAANHLSWLDILVVAANWRVSFLSKSEVRSWPGIGLVATGLGTLYIERGGRDASGDAMRAMAQRLRDGHRVLFFPEGTTSPGLNLLPFRPRLFQAAIDAGAPVQPLTIRYLDHTDRPHAVAPFVDDEGLLSHVWRLAAEPAMRAVLESGYPVESAGKGRNELALLCREQMAEALNPSLPHEEEDRERTASAGRC
ncbi:MAG: 1-acyl-sn-glycerol-3-phosphate acyltransferase [Ectothiorhodospiraceae bacterium]|nr:1-acyl-sn-glycerol-3-phosphate acyltransferase [Ectothiorhodospiraceae bacterium]MCH8506633.1 1-acyl-sn-glycerol-3-phosphate acyltransferase [Ectothiorhodospiraceae bacterium]